MQLLEYQAKELLCSAGIPTPPGQVIKDISEINPSSLSYPIVLKSQVPVGGRGKLGGVKLVRNADEFLTSFQVIKVLEIKGYRPDSILIEKAVEIERELYLALRVNRDKRRIEWIASGSGGIDIESNTSSVVNVPYDQPASLETLSKTLQIDEMTLKPLLKALHTCMIDNDLLLVEINPLVVTKDHTLIAADAKLELDDNALFRQPAYANQAISSGIIALGGTIGVIANGAGMAMSTMDTIYAAGGRPANFLDIGGGTGEDVFIRNIREINQLPGVTSIIVNIFAGITHCDDIARGIIAAKREIDDLVPLYIRLEGTNRDEAARLLKDESIEMQPDLASCVRNAMTPPEGRTSQATPTTTAAPPLESGSISVVQGAIATETLPVKDGGAAVVDAMSEGYVSLDLFFQNNPVIVQGITGHHGAFHTKGMLAAGTNIVAGVTPGKAGNEVEGIPVYNSVPDAIASHPANASVIFVPAKFARSAMLEALDAGIKLIVCITEHIPVHDMLSVYRYSVDKNATVIGPNCPGFIVPRSHKLGIIAAHITTPGTTAIVSRSGTLTYELADALTKKGIGQRMVLGIGGDPAQGTNFSEALQICQDDPQTDQIIMVGEIGGNTEQIAADYAEKHVTKPIYGLVVGHSLPAGQQFGHAGAIVGSLGESASEKTDHMRKKGIVMARTLDELISAL